jgi:hypothetical protein
MKDSHAHRAGERDADHGDDGNDGSSEAHVWGSCEPQHEMVDE